MDYMIQERQRGITIRAATTAFSWHDYQVNLIDTPGHVDFTAEVERSLRVCDGAVAVFDGMQGVETQSETVWMQANKYKIPRLGFINKLDRVGAVIDTTLRSVKRRLRAEPMLVNIPSDDTNQLSAIIDLPSMMLYTYTDESGKFVDIESLHPSEAQGRDELVARCQQYREQLIEQLSLYDDTLADLYLSSSDSSSDISADVIDLAIKNAIRKEQTVALFCGSALKNKGVQPLLDGILKYLPSPGETGTVMA